MPCNTRVCKNCGETFVVGIMSRCAECCSERCSRDWHAKEHNRKYPNVYKERQAIRFAKEDVIRRYDAKCAICGWQDKTAKRNDQGRLNLSRGNEIHHIVPVKEGGKSEIDNLILLCPNHHKQADWGMLSREELRKFQRKTPQTDEERNNKIQKAMQGKTILTRAVARRNKPEQMKMNFE